MGPLAALIVFRHCHTRKNPKFRGGNKRGRVRDLPRILRPESATRPGPSFIPPPCATPCDGDSLNPGWENTSVGSSGAAVEEDDEEDVGGNDVLDAVAATEMSEGGKLMAGMGWVVANGMSLGRRSSVSVVRLCRFA
jgi:hypothetical protein